ncbi:MAG: hypothetical protein GY906_01680 [bacterium]|nr:hypothetical protein [bacterium]
MEFAQKFLNRPDLCPYRRSGETWGEEIADLVFGDTCYRLVGVNQAQWNGLQQRFGRWMKTKHTVTHVIESPVFRISQSAFKEIDTRGWEYQLDLHHEPSKVRIVGLDFVGLMEGRTGELRGALWTFCDTSNLIVGAVENFLRLLVAYHLLETGGVLLHGAGLSQDGSSLVCYGRSGAGKTTLSRLLQGQGYKVISDDMVALLPAENGLEILPLPFTGELEADDLGTVGLPLTQLCFLRKGEESLRSMDRAEGVASLMTCAPGVNQDPYRRDSLQAVIEKVVTVLPPDELTFRRGRVPRSILGK